jgi:hypothetical protein
MRISCLGSILLCLSTLLTQAQTLEPRITGTVLDEQGQPLKNIAVHGVLEKTGM